MLKRLVYINRNNKEKERKEREEREEREALAQHHHTKPTSAHHHRSRSTASNAAASASNAAAKPRVMVPPAGTTHLHPKHTHTHSHKHTESIAETIAEDTTTEAHTPNYTTTTATANISAAAAAGSPGSPSATPLGGSPAAAATALAEPLPFPAPATPNIESQLLFPAPTPLLPYGDGANKVFGYENFGNTCYCNSVLQCLYHLDSLRAVVLEYPAPPAGAPPHPRRFRTVSKSPRVFTKDSFDGPGGSGSATSSSGGENSGGSDSDSRAESGAAAAAAAAAAGAAVPEKKTSLKQALSRYGSEAVLSNTLLSDAASFSSRKRDDRGKGSASNTGSGSAPAHTTVMSADSLTENLHDSCKTIVVGRKETSAAAGSGSGNTPHSASPVVRGRALSKSAPTSPLIGNNGKGDFAAFREAAKSPAAAATATATATATTKASAYSSEQRKKAALIRGPVLHIDHMMTAGTKPSLYSTLKDIFECITENENLSGVVSPTQFVKTLKRENVLFNSSMQQDAHEFLNFLLNNLNEYLSFQAPSVPPHLKTFILDEFQGTLSNRTKCLTCDTVTTGEEPFLDFPIEVLGQDSIDIQGVLRHYNQREILNGANKFYCNQCYALQEAERLVGIKRLPRTLAINLKRFKYVEEQNANIKLFNKISYPATLNVSTTFDQDNYTSYELTGVVVHLGRSPQHGHYVSLCKSRLFGWLLFDDETVESVDESTVLRFVGDVKDQTTAYVLFYQATGSVDVPQGTIDQVDSAAASPSAEQYEANIAQLIKCDDLITETERRERKRRAQRRRSSVDGRISSEKGRQPAVRERSSKNSSSNKSKRRSRILSFMKS